MIKIYVSYIPNTLYSHHVPDICVTFGELETPSSGIEAGETL